MSYIKTRLKDVWFSTHYPNDKATSLSGSYPNGLLSSEPFSHIVRLMLTVFPESDAKATHEIAKPLNSLTLAERDAVLAEMCRKIKPLPEQNPFSTGPASTTEIIGLDTNDQRTASTILQIDKCRSLLIKLSC
jgi:hypothetical protein